MLLTESAIRQVVGNYKTINTTQKEWSKAEYKKPSFRVCRNRSYSFVKVKTGSPLLSISTIDGRVKVPFTTKGMEKFFDGSWKFCDSIVIQKHGKWFLLLACSKEVDVQDDIQNVVGVDLGINFIAATYGSNGKSEFYPGRAIKQKRSHYKELRRELQQRHTKSSLRRLRKISDRENRWMSDINHCVTKALVKRFEKGTLFVLEDLTGIRGATEKVRRKDRYVQVSWAFYDFRQKLEYKALEAGDQVIFVDPRYTSQECSKCHHTEKANRNRKTHTFKCRECGYTSNDDRIAAMNLYERGIEYLRTVAPK